MSLEIDVLVMPKLTAYLPPTRIEYSSWSHIQGLSLADLNFADPGKVDLLLGVNLYSQIIEEGLLRGPVGTPIAQKTTLGWILSGPLSSSDHDSAEGRSYSVIGMQCSLDTSLLDLLQRFWAQEEIAPRRSSLSPEESQCEQHFKDTHSRNRSGQFVVRLPLKKVVRDLGNSRAPALKSLLHMEKRFESNLQLKEAYHGFLNEYRDLDHMRLASPRAHSQELEFFLPHHGVVRETSSTTKLRVVFNGSQKTNLGLSLNDVLHVGPKLQNDLADILTRWRRHKYVFAADIEKMYRQIRVHEDDWPLQKILWRSSPREQVSEYYLCTLISVQNQLNPKSPLYRLTPQLDSNGLLRGRLQFSKLSSDAKTPLILPRNSRLTTLVIDSHHRRTLHGGPQLTLSSIRQQFWIIGGRVPIRSFIHRCMICARHRAATSQQLIGQLPAPRVTLCRPFFHTGVDYAGPLTLKTWTRLKNLQRLLHHLRLLQHIRNPSGSLHRLHDRRIHCRLQALHRSPRPLLDTHKRLRHQSQRR